MKSSDKGIGKFQKKIPLFKNKVTHCVKHAVLRQRHSTQVNFKWTNFIARSFVAVILIALIFRKVLSIEIFAKFCTAYTINTLTKLKKFMKSKYLFEF